MRTCETSASPLTARMVAHISEIDAADWDRCAGGDNPFLSHAFLEALEWSGSCTGETGWLPQHVTLQDADGAIVGVMPLYAKSHSRGEYVFDHGWADAYARAGGQYYPKMQCAVPFTPVTGQRLLVPPGPDAARRRAGLIGAAVQVTEQFDASSLNITFLTEAEWNQAGDLGCLQRTGEQFHWKNEGYRTFDDFLATLASRKRKAIRKERAQALSNGIEIELLSGDAIGSEHWDIFFEFYIDTGSRKWGTPYLTREFFDRIHETMADRIVLIMCRREGQYVAGALNFLGTDTLYGRYWGCIENHPCLHFEVCYYQAIDIAIDRGLKWVEAGAQGPHKIQRGYLPRHTYSAHWIRDPRLRDAIADYLERERAQVDWEIETAQTDFSPFRKTGK